MMTIGEKIKELRLMNNISQCELAQKINTSNKSVSNWENDVKTPRINMIRLMSKVFDVPISFFLDESQQIQISKKSHFEEMYDMLDAHGKEVVNAIIRMEYQRITAIAQLTPKHIHHIMYFNLPACAGNGNFWTDVSPETIPIEGDIPAGTDFVIPISGDSMEPEYHDGDRIFIHKTDSLEPGEIGVFSADGQVCIKKYTQEGLVPLNPKYEIMKPEEFFIIGKVVGKYEELK